VIFCVRFISNADGSSFLCDIHYLVDCDAYNYLGEVISNLDTRSMTSTSQVVCNADTRGIHVSMMRKGAASKEHTSVWGKKEGDQNYGMQSLRAIASICACGTRVL